MIKHYKPIKFNIRYTVGKIEIEIEDTLRNNYCINLTISHLGNLYFLLNVKLNELRIYYYKIDIPSSKNYIHIG